MRPDPGLPSVWTDALRVSQFAWTVAILVLVPAGVGLWLDRVLDTQPWALLIGALVGTILASIGVTRLVLRRYEEIAPSSPGGDDRARDRFAEEDERA